MRWFFWGGFIVILFGSIEMVIDGLFGTERVFSFMGWFYDFLMASGDIFAAIIAVSILVFLFRRLFMHVKRFYGPPEMKPVSKADANLALSFILFLMISLLGMNTFYLLETHNAGHNAVGVYPVSVLLADLFANMSDGTVVFLASFQLVVSYIIDFYFCQCFAL